MGREKQPTIRKHETIAKEIKDKGNVHNGTGDPRTKDALHTPHAEDDNRIVANRQAVPGMQPPGDQHAPQGLQDQESGSLSHPNSAGALSLEPTSSPAQGTSWERSTPPQSDFNGTWKFYSFMSVYVRAR